jgi:hypothetical protein
MSVNETSQLSALRNLVFGEIQRWNAGHPHPLRSHQEHGSVSVTEVYADSGGAPSYAITVVCALAGSAQLAFHGHDLAAVAEHARLTLEHRISAEVQHRAEKASDDAFDRGYAVAG